HPLAAYGIGNGRQSRRHLHPARLCSQWHGHREARAAAGARLQFDPVAEQAAQPVDDCKTQAETIAAVRRTARELVELAEYTLPSVCRKAGPGIADLDAQLRPAVAATDHHPAALRVAHRIGYEIKRDALEQDGIARYPGFARDHAQSQPLLARRIGEGGFDE